MLGREGVELQAVALDSRGAHQRPHRLLPVQAVGLPVLAGLWLGVEDKRFAALTVAGLEGKRLLAGRYLQQHVPSIGIGIAGQYQGRGRRQAQGLDGGRVERKHALALDREPGGAGWRGRHQLAAVEN